MPDVAVKNVMAKERKLFKHYFDQDAAKRLGMQFRAAWNPFPVEDFIGPTTLDLKSLEFHGRVCQFADALSKSLPEETSVALEILMRSLPPPLATCNNVTDGWLQWPLAYQREVTTFPRMRLLTATLLTTNAGLQPLERPRRYPNTR
ncbi:MAG: hypothetical protein KTR25_08740 [Myxococcales bacterium]|nr:hypothetical protein [Myxococcales bacterium]